MTILEQAINRTRSSYPTQEIGIAGFTLFARVSERVSLTADNPMFYVEDGTPLNDHRIQKPEIVSISGTVGDVYRSPSTVQNSTRNLFNDLGIITQYAPQLTQSQLLSVAQVADQAVDQIESYENAIIRGQSFNSIFGNQDVNSKPLGEQFVDAIENIHYSNQLISINMPYRVYKNMSITSVSIERDNTTNAINFSLEATKIRVADLNFVEVEKIVRKPAKAIKAQGDKLKEKGRQEGTQATENDILKSGASSIFEGFGDFLTEFKKIKDNAKN